MNNSNIKSLNSYEIIVQCYSFLSTSISFQIVFIRIPSSLKCREKDRIKSEEQCKAIANSLLEKGNLNPFPFSKKVSSLNRPAGCYWYENDYFKNSFFNVDDPDKENWDSNAGRICQESG